MKTGSVLYIGLMSGTSMDGVDGVLVDFSGGSIHVLRHSFLAFPNELRAQFFALNTPGANEIHGAALAGNALARLYAQVVETLLQQSGLEATQIMAIGAHGQTVRHQPQAFDGVGYTVQINQPALLAELTGIDVIADFRSRDVAAGGQGAPLVPPFHDAIFGRKGSRRAVLNIGGMSNITLLPNNPDDPLLGFDCGPGNVLLDGWCMRHLGTPYDDAGAWAQGGKVHLGLLEVLQSEPFFALKGPKSTGRDLFHPAWLDQQLKNWGSLNPQDVQATLSSLTAWACLGSIPNHWHEGRELNLIVCGGGALNLDLMHRLATTMPKAHVASSSEFGLPPLQVEAAAFAWLAYQTIQRLPANEPAVTGAKGRRILGAIYPK